MCRTCIFNMQIFFIRGTTDNREFFYPSDHTFVHFENSTVSHFENQDYDDCNDH